MRSASKFLLVFAVALELFCFWGLATAGGNQAFDEMDGLIPVFAGLLGAFFGMCGIALWWLARHRAGKN